MRSLYDKLNLVKKQENGVVVHEIYKNPKSKEGEMRTFKSHKVFKAWKESRIEAYLEELKKKLTPH